MKPGEIRAPFCNLAHRILVISCLLIAGIELTITMPIYAQVSALPSGHDYPWKTAIRVSVASHAKPNVNPFYVALPFDDLTHPELAELAKKWMPSLWPQKLTSEGKPVSACLGRWIEIVNANGLHCFAQWEDFGPDRSDDVGYVFGPNHPKSGGSGLGVSIEVARYLQLDDHQMVSWRFVDDKNLPPGIWLRTEEETLLFHALQKSKSVSIGASYASEDAYLKAYVELNDAQKAISNKDFKTARASYVEALGNLQLCLSAAPEQNLELAVKIRNIQKKIANLDKNQTSRRGP